MMLEFSTEFNENLIGNDFDRKGKGWVGRKFKQKAHNESWKTKKKYKKTKRNNSNLIYLIYEILKYS